MKTPWHLWVIGVVALLWTSGGAFDYVMTVTKNPSYMWQFTPEQLDFFYGFPTWVMFCWALAVWAAILGAVLLLLRSGHAVLAFAMSLFGLVGNMVYLFALSETSYLEIVGPGALWFSLAIAVVAILLYLYARQMRQAGVLR